MLHEASTLGAAFDSAERYPPPKCIPGTRENVIEQIMDAMTGPNGSPICWLNGNGWFWKISSGTIAELCANQGRLAGSFSFPKLWRNIVTLNASISQSLIS